MRPDNTRNYIGAAVAVALAAGLGFGVARMTAPVPSAPAAKPEAPKAGPGKLAITPAALQAAGVQVEAASGGGLGGEILAAATVAAAPDGQAVLTAHAQGAVTKLYKRLGDPVRAGETVALVESREASSIAADRSVASSKLALAKQALAREQRLYDQKVSPRQDVERAEAEVAAANAEFRRAEGAAGAARLAGDGRSVRVTSSIDGRITTAGAALGSYVSAETELFRVADPRRIQVEASASAADAARIAPGDAAILETGTANIPATVRSVTPTLSQDTRAAVVVLSPSGPEGLQPGQLIRARLRPKSPGSEMGVAVPDEAVQSVNGRDAVFIRTADGFRVQPVTVGRRSGGRAEIVEGLNAGQMVAAKNAFLLKAELGKGAEEEE